VAGGLSSYGFNFADTFCQTGIYTGRILKGEKPAGLPVQQATKIELIFSKALGLTFPAFAAPCLPAWVKSFFLDARRDECG
jgi:ABC-type uncharacterized transport system substrate-binding protein